MVKPCSHETPAKELTEEQKRALVWRRLVHMILVAGAAGAVATVAVIVSRSLEIAKREPEIETWTLLSLGVLMGLVGSIMRVLAHDADKPLDYYGKLFGVSAAVLTLWGVLVRMPVELSSFTVYLIGGIAALVAVSFTAGLRIEKAVERRKARDPRKAPPKGL